MLDEQAFPKAAVAEVCRRWQVQELALFGSALRADFGPGSDIDLLVTFAPGSTHSLFDLARMESEFAGVLGRRVDLVSRRGLERSENWVRRQEILSTARTVYAA